jgi:signal transduction histidine kinase
MTPTVALAGWAAAAVATLAVLFVRRTLTCRMELIARACHELRGPLTAARLGLELGTRLGSLSPARLRALDLELGRAALAIDDLSELGQRSRSPGRWEEVELRGLLTDSVEAWRSCAGAHGAELRLSWSGGPAFVHGDRLRLAQATGNLLANAIEHGGGELEVRVSSGPARDDTACCGERGLGDAGLSPGRIRIEFVDDGPGLPAPVAELARRGRHTRRARGHGLSVANAVVSAHGGRLAAAPVESGARIVLELPLVARRVPALVGSVDGSEPEGLIP